jgi:Protein of unknown function (DUF1757)
MSRYFPHTAYAEDQPYPHTILTTHVLHRGFQAGALLGCTGVLSYTAYRRYVQPPKEAIRASSAAQGMRNTLLPNTLRATGIGATAGAALMGAMLVPRMWSKEEIEWQDRAWRLLENEGQMSVDDWSLEGMLVGVAAAVLAARRGLIVIKNRPMAVVGAAGLGSLSGTEGSMAWRALKGTSVKEGRGSGEAAGAAA